MVAFLALGAVAFFAARPAPEADRQAVLLSRTDVEGKAPLLETSLETTRHRARRPRRTPRPAASSEGGRAAGSGNASYYGDELRGRPTASGEAFDPEGYTAAHRSLPLGSRLRVTNVGNGRSVVVRVNDRGPYAGDRVIDVSKQAARALGMLGGGTARVRLELLPSRG